MTSFFSKLWSGTKAFPGYVWKHKIISVIVLVILAGGGYWAYAAIAAGNASTEYVLSTVTKGPLQVTVTGSGQVDSEDDLSVTPQGSASGEITQIYVTPGQQVSAGQTIAQLDDTTAAQAVTSAQQDLESAQISYQQTLTSSQTSVTSDQASLASDITNTYTNLPAVMNGLDTILHGFSTITGENAVENVNAYANYISSAQAQGYESEVIQDDAAAVSAYQTAQAQYAAAPVSSLTAAQLQQLAQTSIQATTAINTALTDTLTYYNYINDQVQSAKLTTPPQLASQISSLTSYETTVSSDNTSLVNDLQTLVTNSQTLSTQSSTPLNVQSAQLAVQKAQAALTQAETDDADYTVVAPFSGTIATVPVNPYDQASSGTTIATLITNEDYADLSLNEADVATVQVGQPVTMTFDALPNVTVNGSVKQIDPVGTVTDGVVTYSVEISFAENNPEVKPGMSVDATIITNSAASAIQVPSSAIKTSGNSSYVQVATLTNASSTLASMASSSGSSAGHRTRTASSTSGYAGYAGRTGSSTGAFGSASGATSSTTPMVTAAAFSRSLTVPANEVTIKEVPVTVGLTNDTETQIVSGLEPGEYVVTATQTTATTKAATATPTATSLLGGSTSVRTGSYGGGGGFTGGGGGFSGGGAGGAGRGG